jgi:pathogenesis-related protein 1
MICSTLAILAFASLALGVPTQNLSPRAVSAADQQAYLDAHNTVRAQHGAVALVWNQTLSDAGASWASRCVFEHSGGSLGPYGENLAAGTGSFGATQAVQLWTDEESTTFICLLAFYVIKSIHNQ